MLERAVAIATGLCRRFEGFYSAPYLCPAGVPTIGYGTIRYPDGRSVSLRDAPITKERAEELLAHDLNRVYLPAVLRQCPTLEADYQIGAVLSWTYNLGEGNLQASTMRRRILARQFDEVPEQMLRWVYARNKLLRGLVNRRRVEAGVFVGVSP